MRLHCRAIALGTSFLIQGNRPVLAELAHLGWSTGDVIREGIKTWVELRNDSHLSLALKATPSSLFFDRLYESLITTFTWSSFTYLIDDLTDLCRGICSQLERFIELMNLSDPESSSINLCSADDDVVIIEYLY